MLRVFTKGRLFSMTTTAVRNNTVECSARRNASAVATKSTTDTLWRYRRSFFYDPNPKSKILGELVMASFWYWIMINLYYNSELITGDGTFPNVLEFTDEQLGIPPDDEELDEFTS